MRSILLTLLAALWLLPAAVSADGAARGQVSWRLYGKNLQGRPGNNFTATCAQAHATSITFTARSDRGGQTRTTTVPCPAGDSSGDATIDLPAGGSWMLSARLTGNPRSGSTFVCHIKPGEWADVWIYAEGCDAPQCTDSCRKR